VTGVSISSAADHPVRRRNAGDHQSSLCRYRRYQRRHLGPAATCNLAAGDFIEGYCVCNSISLSKKRSVSIAEEGGEAAKGERRGNSKMAAAYGVMAAAGMEEISAEKRNRSG